MTAPTGRYPFTPFGFDTWMGHPPPMERPHRHNEIELNFLWEGEAWYLSGGKLLNLPLRRLSIFWGAVPHHIVKLDRACRLSWVTLPLSWILRWDLPKAFVERLLHGEWIVDRDDHALDEALLPRWHQDRERRKKTWRKVAALEAEARVSRLAVAGESDDAGTFESPAPEGAILLVEKVARYVAEHFDSPLHIPDLAKVLRRHPNYLMQVFKQRCGVSIGEYLAELRISNAQRLLATTDRKIADIAQDSGFATLSSFYDAFSRAVGMPPGAYRSANRVRRTKNRYADEGA